MKCGPNQITLWLVRSIIEDSSPPFIFWKAMLVLGGNHFPPKVRGNTWLGWYFLVDHLLTNNTRLRRHSLAGHPLAIGTWLGNRVLSWMVILPFKPWITMAYPFALWALKDVTRMFFGTIIGQRANFYGKCFKMAYNVFSIISRQVEVYARLTFLAYLARYG